MAISVKYKTLKIMFETGNVKTFNDIFNVVPKTVIANDLGMNYSRFLVKIRKLEEFTLRDLIKLSSYMEADSQLIIRVILNDLEKRKTTKKKG